MTPPYPILPKEVFRSDVIRFVLHQRNCGKHRIMDPHWIDVYTGISWVKWSPELFEHLRSKRR